MADMKPKSKANKDRNARSLAYWEKREKEALNNYVKDEAEYSRQINEIYQNMLDACQREINAFYGSYAAKEGISIAEAKKRVSQLDIAAYERKAKRYVRDKDFSEQANEEMRLYNLTMKVNRLEMLKANIGLELISGHDELEKFMAEILKGRTMEELERQAGILGKTIKNNAQKAESIVNASFHNATFSQRIWMHQNEMKAELSKLLQSGLIQGKNPRVLARDMRKLFVVKQSDAERLMITELARVQTDAQQKSFERNGYEEYTFICNDGACTVCRNLNGKHFKVADMMPGKNASPMHPRCRCSTAAHSDRKEYEEWLEFLEKGGTTAEYNKMKSKNGAKTEIPLKKLNGTKKQVAWADEIRKDAIKFVKGAIENDKKQNEKIGFGFFDEEIEAYEKCLESLIEFFSKTDNASVIINNRVGFEPESIMKQVRRYMQKMKGGG